MISLVKSTIDFYLKNLKKPELKDLTEISPDLLNHKGSIFVTIYHKGDIRGSAGNIVELKENIATEIIENTIKAISDDSRFKPLNLNEAKEIKIRVDFIKNRKIFKEDNLNSIEPTKAGIIVIKKDYEKMAALLPNINPKLLTGEDYIDILKEKLKENEFNIKDYHIYEIETEIQDNFDK